jgi:hydroxypyruvate reductase
LRRLINHAFDFTSDARHTDPHRHSDCAVRPLRHAARNDSYSFFDPLGDLLKTGPTNTNVMDVRLLLIGN